ncbi:MAG: tetratricopeptide repeat protein [Patescibacteria group bacterium]
MQKDTIIGAGAGVAILVGIVAYGWYVYGRDVPAEKKPLRYTHERPPNVVLAKDNKAFAVADNYFKNGRFTAALEKYNEAILKARNPIEENQILYRIALTTERRGNAKEAIPLYKELIANPEAISFIKAYSAQELALMLVSPETIHLAPDIFSGDPYASFNTEGNRALSNRKMFEYASSFYPLALSELRVADWYAEQLLKPAVRKPVSASHEYVGIIEDRMKNADADITRTFDSPSESGFLDEILTRKAVVIGKLAIVKIVSHEEAERAFADAFNLIAVRSPGTSADRWMRYYHARYLLNVPSSETRVRDIIAPFYETNIYKDGEMKTFFKNERTNKQGQKVYLQKMATIDSDFKKYLLGLGWQPSDFPK